ncbi:MAG: hypothetical protein AB1896_09235 [Thermodesulfobacteriota bacterium]
MIKNLETIEQTLTQLCLRHPELMRISVKSPSEISTSHPILDYGYLADFIARAWDHTYRSKEGRREVRFHYTPGYLEWLLASPWLDKNLTGIALDHEERVLGLSYGINKTLRLGGKSFRIGLHSGLSVAPEYVGKGIAQYIHFNVQKKIVESGPSYDGSAYWWDGKNVKRGHSLDTFRRNDPLLKFFSYDLLNRIFDYERALDNISLIPLQKPFAKFLSGVPEPRLPHNYQILEFASGDLEEVQLFLNEIEIGELVGRYQFNKEELWRILSFRPRPDDIFTTFCTLLRSDGALKGALYGYRTPLVQLNTDQVMFLDGIWIAPHLDPAIKKAFVAESLRVAYEAYDVYAALTMKGTFPVENCPRPLFQPVTLPQWIPQKRHFFMGIFAYSQEFDEELKKAQGFFIDHK